MPGCDRVGRHIFRVRLDRKFSGRINAEPLANRADDPLQVFGRRSGRRPSAEEDRIHPLPARPPFDLREQRVDVRSLQRNIGADHEGAVGAVDAAEWKVNVDAEHSKVRGSRSEVKGKRNPFLILPSNLEPRTFSILYNRLMSEVSPETASRRPRLLWTLLGAMVLVGLLPLVVSHYFLMGINRDSLETLEKKYLTRAAVSIATDVQTLIASNTQQLNTIAASVLVMKRALPPDMDIFGYIDRRGAVASYIPPDSDLL